HHRQPTCCRRYRADRGAGLRSAAPDPADTGPGHRAEEDPGAYSQRPGQPAGGRNPGGRAQCQPSIIWRQHASGRRARLAGGPGVARSPEQRACRAGCGSPGGRQLLESQLGSLAWGKVDQQHPRQASLWRRLVHLGLPADLCRSLLSKVEEVTDIRQAWRLLLAHLAQSIPVMRSEPIDQGGVIALVGPTGAGKTTTLGKLAARYVLKHGSEHVALVTMDTFRIGAHEQLRTLGRILNVPVRVVDEQHSLQDVLDEFANKRLVLVDTAGLQAQDPQLRGQLKELAALGDRVS